MAPLAVRILQYGQLRWTAHELISANCFFNSLHKINIFLLLSRNLFWTAISVVHKSDVRNENKCLLFTGALTGMRHYHRYFTEL